MDSTPKQEGPPPAYATNQYPPPGAYPPPGGYPPPMHAYPPQGYAPQPYMMPAPQMQQQSSNNVVVVNSGAPSHTVVVERRGVNHCLHCVITLFFFPWIIVWIILCITDGC